MKIQYKCKENTNELAFITFGDKIDEIWVKADGDKGYTVISYKDMLNGIKKANKKIIKNNSK